MIGHRDEDEAQVYLPVQVGHRITVGEADYRYGIGTLEMRVTAVEGVSGGHLPGDRWVALRGHAIFRTATGTRWEDDQERIAAVRLSALTRAHRPAIHASADAGRRTPW